jgi:hypothetical protein
MITSAPATAAAGVAACCAPCATSGAQRSGVRFQTVTLCPALSRLAAMPRPMMPRPR